MHPITIIMRHGVSRSDRLRCELLDLRDDPDVAPDRRAHVFEAYVRAACEEGRRPDVLPTVWFRVPASRRPS